MAAEHAGFREGEDPASLIETGRALVAKHMANAAPSVKPKEVELPSKVYRGSRVQGVVDLLDVDGWIVDCNTATRSHTGVQFAIDDIFDDHAQRERLVRSLHHHEDQDR